MYAKDIMTRDIVTLKPDTGIFEAIALLVDSEISGAPVLDDTGTVVGIVSEKDLLVALDYLGIKKAESASIKQFMTKDIVSFPEDATVEFLMQELVRNNIKRVPILCGKTLVGIVSRRDVLRCIEQNRNQGPVSDTYQ